MKWWRKKVNGWQKCFIGWGLTIGVAARASAQVPVGDGVEATYYEGTNFERLLVRRREATISDDQWGRNGPLPGVPAEFFSVRWAGWLVPPVSGRYVLHFSADDGVRVWLNDHLVLNEWGIHPAERFSVAVPLRAGQPCKVRVDYFQSILHTRARLTWEPPEQPEPASWRNAWGMRSCAPEETTIPTRYLFIRLPGRAATVPRRPIADRVPPSNPRIPTQAARKPVRPPQGGRPAAKQPSTGPVSRRVSAPPKTSVPRDSVSDQRVAQLRAGREMVLPELRFNQGQATLPPAAWPVLDELAIALQAHPALRLEVQGHTDNQGNAELNRQLSQQRAEAVCLYLTAHGVASEQLQPVGYGGTRPVADNNDPFLRPRNRRVVLNRR